MPSGWSDHIGITRVGEAFAMVEMRFLTVGCSRKGTEVKLATTDSWPSLRAPRTGAPPDPLTRDSWDPWGSGDLLRAFYLSLRAPRTGAPPDPLTSELVGSLGEQRPVAGVLPLYARTAYGRSTRSVNERARGTLGGAATYASVLSLRAPRTERYRHDAPKARLRTAATVRLLYTK